MECNVKVVTKISLAQPSASADNSDLCFDDFMISYSTSSNNFLILCIHTCKVAVYFSTRCANIDFSFLRQSRKQCCNLTEFPPKTMPNDERQSISYGEKKYILNPFTPTSDQDRISPYNINTISSRQVMRIEKNINYGIIS